MAGNYYENEDYLAEQNRALSEAILGANQNGTAPLPDTPPTPAPAPAEDQHSAYRRYMSLGAGAVPFYANAVSALPGVLGTAAIPVQAIESNKRGTMQSFAPEEKLSAGPLGPPLALKATPGEYDLKPMNQAYPEVQAAPTLASQARNAVGGSLAMGDGGMGGLLGKWRGAQQAQVDTMGHGADLALDLGQNKADAQSQMADLRAAQAAQMQRDAEDQQRIEADANARHESFLAKSQQMSDAITSTQLDPTRFLHNADSKTQLLIGLGSAIGGMLSAEHGGPNRYLEQLDGIVDRDFKGQLANLDNQRAGLSARNTVFGQIMAQTQDRRLGDMQARDLMYTAMKTNLLARADKLGIPEIMTQAKIAANEIENKQRTLQEQIAAQSYKSAQAAAAASASAARAAEERAWQHSIEIMKLNQEQQKIDKAGGEGKAKDVGERSVVIDGKDALAVNKTAAEKWNEYNHGREVFNVALQKLVKARDAGDVGAYDAARAQLIEEYPKLLGYTRAPTEGQISHTVGPNAIPEYNHWYDHAKYGPAGPATFKVAQGRAQEKIDFLKETLATSDKSMRENTFGANAPIAGANAPSFQPDGKTSSGIPKTGMYSPENPWLQPTPKGTK